MKFKVGDRVRIAVPEIQDVPGGRAGVTNQDIGIVKYTKRYDNDRDEWVRIFWLTGIQMEMRRSHDGSPIDDSYYDDPNHTYALWSTTSEVLALIEPANNRQATGYLRR